MVFTINGETIDVGDLCHANLNDVMDAINKSNAGVKIRRSLRDRFVMNQRR